MSSEGTSSLSSGLEGRQSMSRNRHLAQCCSFSHKYSNSGSDSVVFLLLYLYNYQCSKITPSNGKLLFMPPS